MTDPSFLGRGWDFPPRADRHGDVVMVDDVENVRRAVLLIMQTEPGERIMRPDFGCGLRSFVFDSITESTLALIRLAVQTGLATWEPRIVVDNVRVTADDAQPGRLLVEVGYRIRATNTFYNLVYPFYLQEARP
jgi:phage baseplate assembly protein W